MKIKCISLNHLNEVVTDDGFGFKYMLPGETANIQSKEDKNVREADITIASPHRKKVVCPIFYECGGCDFLHMTYDYQLELKQTSVQTLFDKKSFEIRVNPIIRSEKPLNYRHKVVLSAKTNKQKLRLGLYREKTREVIPFLNCFIHDKDTNLVLKTLEMLLNKYKIPAYDLQTNQGILKHVMIRKSLVRQEMMVVFVTQGTLMPNGKKISQDLVKKHPKVVTTVQNIHRKRTHLVLLEEEKIIYGPGYIIDNIADLSFRLSARSFYQVNPEQMLKLYSRAIEMADLKNEDIVLDAYSGIGTLSLLIAKHVKQVIAIEVNKDAHLDALNNKKYNQVDNVDFINEDVNLYLENMESEIDVLFMDPTRDGSTPEFLNAVKKLGPTKIVYISCEPKTQVRDLEHLKESYEINEVQPVDMFSQTEHIENIVLLSLKKQ